MKILQVTAPKEFRVMEVPLPEPGPGQVRMRIEAVTTCPQWDLHLRHNDPMFIGHQFKYPYTMGQPGHEATGFVDAIGPGVTGLAVGDRVSAWRDAGHDRPGCYAQFVVHLADNVIRVPANVSPEAVAPIELAMCVATVFRMMRDMGVVRGRRVGITGMGPAGLIALQMARAEGAASVFGFDPVEERRVVAVGLGADACFDPTAVSEAEFPLRPSGSCRLDSAVDCVGARSSVAFLMDRTIDTLALFGVQREDYTYAPRHGGLRLCGYKGHFRASAEYAVELIAAGKLNLAPLVTHRLPLSRYGEGVDLLEARKAIKVCFLPWE
ncbi:MAG: alcohol dehydrogenase catalytic domain-containing protein [Planctomycetota bacterium]|nr:alcohol dehydrogenase catalytic domain-containing protein [Planctomycetota bacterium]